MATQASCRISLYVFADDDEREARGLDVLTTLLSPAERERFGRTRHASARRDFVLSRTLLRFGVARQCSLQWRAIEFAPGVHGRPRLATPRLINPPHLSLSHTSGMIAVALGAVPTGVDVEGLRRQVRYREIATRFFAASETQDLLRQSEKEQKQRFFFYWTLKEAYVKALGLGMHRLFNTFALSLDGDSIGLDANETDRDAWRFSILAPKPDFVLALATRTAGVPLAVTVNLIEGVGELVKRVTETVRG